MSETMKAFEKLKKEKLGEASRARRCARQRRARGAHAARSTAGFARTQAEMGEALEMSQSQLSRVESRSDHLISTLRRYIEALAGALEITARIGGRRSKIADA